MAIKNSFTLQGATPSQPNILGGSMGGSTTPVAKALDNTANNSYYNQLSSGIANFASNMGSPTQTPKSSTMVSPDGTKVTHTYDTQNNNSSGNSSGLLTSPPSGTANGYIVPQGQSNPQPSQQQAPSQGSYTGFVNNLNNAAYNPSQATQQGLLTAGKTAQQISDLQAQLGASRKNENQTIGDIERNPIPLQFQQGQAQATQSQYVKQQDAISQQIAGLSNLYGPSLNAAVSGQGQQITAAQQGGALTQPQLAATGQQAYYNPLTQQQAPGGNTPFGGGQVQGDVALGQQYAQNVSANNQAKAIKSSVQTYLAQNPTLNPSLFPDVNTALQFLNGKVSNPQYQVLSNQLQEYINTLAPILGVGGDTTNLKTQIANGFINAKASGQSISQVLDGIEQLANAKLAAQQGGSGSTGGATGQQSTGGGIFSW